MLYRYILLGLLSAASMAFACLSGRSNLLDRKKERVIFKTLASLMFCLTAVAGAALSLSHDYLYGALIISALVFGAAGDVLLTLNGYFGGRKGKQCETAGVVFFAAGHLTYIALFVSTAGARYFLLPLAALCPLFLYLGGEKLGGLKLGKFRPVAFAYSLILGLMLFSVINYFISHIGSTRSYLVLVAGLLFVLSDGAHILKEYGPLKGNKKLIYFVLITYYAAQSLFAFSLIL